MTAPVTVLIPTMPGREEMLGEALASVYAQTVAPAAVLVRWSRPERIGPVHIAAQRNRLLAAVDTPWVATLDDDDLWRPDHLETVLPVLDFDVTDVVHTWTDPEGTVPRVDVTGWPQPKLIAALRAGNFIPSAALIRTETIRAAGGWSESGFDGRRYATWATWEDWDCWIRLAEAGARFVTVPKVTWEYRMGSWPRASVLVR